MTAVLDTTIPAGLDRDGMSRDERRQFETLRAHRALGLIMQRVPMWLPMWNWSIRIGVHGAADNTIGIEGHFGSMPNDHASRAALMGLAEQFGLEYAEKPHLSENIITATGMYAGVRVRFFDLVQPCLCGCRGGAR
jgi:hypothetical protein